MYNADIRPPLRIARIRRLNGYAPRYETINGEYALQILDANGKVIKSVPFVVPAKFEDPPPLGRERGGPLVLKRVEFALTVEEVAGAAVIRVAAPDGTVITSQSLSDSLSVSNTSSFSSVSPNVADVLDVTFIGDNYLLADLDIFHDDVAQFIANLLTYEPFAGRNTQLAFHYVDNTTDLGCTYSGRLIICNNSRVIQQVNNAGAPYDKIVVIVNNGTYGGSATLNTTCCAVAYNGGWGPQVFVHELGHLLGGLLDEYTLYTTDGPIDNVVRMNCYAGPPPAQDWEALVVFFNYALGCKYSNWYRASSRSVMYAIDSYTFNVVSQALLENRLDYYAGGTADITPPVVSISSPSSDSTVSGLVSIAVSASDNSGIVSRVELYKDGALFGTDTASPFTFSWDAVKETNGSHSLQAKAYDPSGNVGTSAMITLTVQNTADTIPPTVVITSPTSDATVSGHATISANAWDNIAVAQVQFLIDNRLLATDSTSPYTTTWNTKPKRWLAGQHAIQAVAVDTSGNKSTAQLLVTLRK